MPEKLKGGVACLYYAKASLKMAILLHTVANWRFIMIIAVYSVGVFSKDFYFLRPSIFGYNWKRGKL